MVELKDFLAERGIESHYDQEIKPFTTIRIGGKVRCIVVVKKRDHLEELLLFLHRHEYPFVLLGGGSNVVFPDQSLGLTVIVNRSGEIKRVGGNLLAVDSGVTIKDLLAWNSGHQAGGMEFLAGIPGTIGGAAAVNAGAFGKALANILVEADIFTNNSGIKTVTKEYFRFAYRDSIFKYGSEVILGVYLTFTQAGSSEIKREIGKVLKYRKENHPPFNIPTAGCFFKNPTDDNNQKVSAGQLIEKSGLSGTTYKSLLISPAHANFLVNTGFATFADISGFAEDIRQRVLEQQGILLEREVIYISPQGQKY